MPGQIGTFRGAGLHGNGGNGHGPRLKGWKQIAAFFGTDERTVKRWEVKRGLPVRRGPAGAGGTVYADVAELETWLKRRADPIPPQAGAGGMERRWRRRLAVAGLSALLLTAALAALTIGRGDAEAVGHQPSQDVADLYLTGVYHWERRTPESLNRAVHYFSQAIARDPDYAAAHAGLANCYLLLREYTRMPAGQAYPRARAAAERALALDDRLPEAHVASAFVTFYWSQDFAAGLRGFERAIALDPRSARAHHWYATALYHSGDIAAALRHINRAQGLEPQSRSIRADKGLILFHAGRTAEAVSLLRQIAASEPEFQSPHAYLALIHLAQGDEAAYLGEARAAARLRGDEGRLAVLDAAERGLRRGGRDGMLRAMLAEQRRLHAGHRESAYALAGTHAMLGDADAALLLLRDSARAREPDILSVRVDPMFRALHGDAAFRRLASRIGRSA